MSISVSLVIPAYNEVRRLPPYLNSIRVHFLQQFADLYEVIVVDDGSTDGLASEVERLSRGWPQMVHLRHAANRGKGAAVRTGMLAAKGSLLLFADADGATPIDEERRLRAAIDAGAHVAIGSRRVGGEGIVRRRTWARSVIGGAFAQVARVVLRLPVHDTQCGFKMFRREAGRRLFQLGQEERYLFDLELLILAQRLGYRVAEVPISWSDVPGSRLKMSREFWRIALGLWRLRHRLITLEPNSLDN